MKFKPSSVSLDVESPSFLSSEFGLWEVGDLGLRSKSVSGCSFAPPRFTYAMFGHNGCVGRVTYRERHELMLRLGPYAVGRA
ncbi:hypothetical protein NPIL_109701 [Nephila pilipes]|uniref:Uncharacterized protein n=1 Tax=Nephila pilipes TaxID=299642 RepID=A0A8X6Q1Z7_NEPPI|nr:hypothetical protein NPIL_109701 [Nephila pilipes]